MLRPCQPSPLPLSPTMQPPTANSLTLKRKKWTEEEERSLIDKYAEMQSDGILARMRTREKKFRPIASHVNAEHHSVDPAAYPFLWSWKDASTKVQNMRHQYLLVKQKLLSSSSPSSSSVAVTTEPAACETDWSQGLSLWPNFLRYRHVFGDAPLPPKLPDAPSSATATEPPVSAVDTEGNLILDIGFNCSDEDGGFDYEEAPPPLLLPPPQFPSPSERRKKKKRRKREGREWARISAALAELREREERLEERDQEKIGWAQEEEERERGVRDAEEERLRRREREDREWEDKMERRRLEWRKRMEVMMEQHRAEMEQIQTRVLHEQQSVVNQLIGLISHWAAGGGGCGIGDITGMGGGSAGGGQHYVSQMMQGMHHLNEMVTGENRIGSDGPEDHFIDDA